MRTDLLVCTIKTNPAPSQRHGLIPLSFPGMLRAVNYKDERIYDGTIRDEKGGHLIETSGR